MGTPTPDLSNSRTTSKAILVQSQRRLTGMCVCLQWCVYVLRVSCGCGVVWGRCCFGRGLMMTATVVLVLCMMCWRRKMTRLQCDHASWHITFQSYYCSSTTDVCLRYCTLRTVYAALAVMLSIPLLVMATVVLALSVSSLYLHCLL